MIGMVVENRTRHTCAQVAARADNVASMAGDGTGSLNRDSPAKAAVRFKRYWFPGSI